MAQQIIEGYIPYRDFIDINFPGIYALHAVVLSLLGNSDTDWTVFVFLWLAFTSYISARYCWKISRLAAVLIPGLFICLVVGMGVFSFGQRDFFMVLFLLVSLDQFAEFLESSELEPLSWIHRKLFWSGFFLGAATSIKPTPIVLFVAFISIIFLRALVRSLRKKSRISITQQYFDIKYLLGQSFILFSGIAIIPGAFTVWLVLNDGFNPFLEIIFDYIFPIYSGLHRLNLDLLTKQLLLRYWPLIMNMPLLLISFTLVKKKEYFIRIGLLFLTICYGIFHFIFQGKGWDYQLFPFLFCVVLLQAILFGLMLQEKYYFQIVALFWLLLTLSINGFIIKNSSQAKPELILRGIKPAVPALVGDLQTLGISPEKRVQVMDVTEGGLHVLYFLNQRQATSYIYDFLFLNATNQIYVRNLQTDFIIQLHSIRPEWVVIFSNGWEQQEKGIARFRTFPEFITLLNNEYHPVIEREQYIIYERIRIINNGSP